ATLLRVAIGWPSTNVPERSPSTCAVRRAPSNSSASACSETRRSRTWTSESGREPTTMRVWCSVFVVTSGFCSLRRPATILNEYSEIFSSYAGIGSPEQYGGIDLLDGPAGAVVDARHVGAAGAEVALHGDGARLVLLDLLRDVLALLRLSRR